MSNAQKKFDNFDDVFRIKSDSDINAIFKYDKIIFIKRNYIENAVIFEKITIIIQFILFNDDVTFDDFDINRSNDHKLFF